MTADWILLGLEPLLGPLLIAAAFYAFRIGRFLRDRAARPAAVQQKPAPDAVADLLETKHSIRRDELRRWCEAWQRAADLPDFWAAANEIRAVEYDAVRADRERKRVEQQRAHLLAIEEARTAREEATVIAREERERETAAAVAHQAHLAARRARYAQRRGTA